MDEQAFSKFVLNEAIKEYKSLFKISALFMSVTLIAFSQGFSVLTKFDYEAKKLEYLIVAQENKAFEQIECRLLKKNMDSCLLAKYQLSYNSTINKFAATVTIIALTFSFLFMFLTPLVYYQKYKKEKHNK